MSAADELDRPMRLMRPEWIEAVDGEAEIVFSDVGSVFVALSPASLAERQVSGRLDGVATHVARLRAGSGIAGGWRLVEGARAFRVLAVDDAGRRSGLVACVLEEETR